MFMLEEAESRDNLVSMRAAKKYLPAAFESQNHASPTTHWLNPPA